jgi:DNA-binding NarL/FixJ family response regulator
MIAGQLPGLQERWAQGLQDHSDVRVVDGQADLQGSVATIQPAVLLLDLSERGGGGIRSLSALHRLCPTTKLMALSNVPTAEEAIAAVKAGATGYCGKDISLPLLKKAVESVRDGQIWIARDLVSSLIGELAGLIVEQRQQSGANGVLDRLSPRERQVAALVSDGASNKEIARRLDVTERTVKTHLSAIFSKLRVSDRYQLALLVNNHAASTGERKREACDDHIHHSRVGQSRPAVASKRRGSLGRGVRLGSPAGTRGTVLSH